MVTACVVVDDVVGCVVMGVAVVDRDAGIAEHPDGLIWRLAFVLSYKSAQDKRLPIPWLHVFAKVSIS